MDPEAERDWVATALAIRLIFEGLPSKTSPFDNLAQWWVDRLATRAPRRWRVAVESWPEDASISRWFRDNNIVIAMGKLGLKPTRDNYRKLVNAARKLENPRCRDI